MNHFERFGIDPGEFADALGEALRDGGADSAEIHEAQIGAFVDSAMPDIGPGEWRIHRIK